MYVEVIIVMLFYKRKYEVTQAVLIHLAVHRG